MNTIPCEEMQTLMAVRLKKVSCFATNLLAMMLTMGIILLVMHNRTELATGFLVVLGGAWWISRKFDLQAVGVSTMAVAAYLFCVDAVLFQISPKADMIAWVALLPLISFLVGLKVVLLGRQQFKDPKDQRELWMNRKTKLAIFALLAVTVLLAVLAFLDTAPYRAQLNALPTKMPLLAVEAAGSNVEADLYRFSVCNILREENPDTKAFDYTSEGRTCLLDAMPKTETAIGAWVFSSVASIWLTKHPGDEEIRTAALAAISHGRDQLIREKPWNYDSLKELAEAHDRSILLMLRDGRHNTDSLFDSLADKLDRAEFAVMLPAVARNQEQWRLKAFTGRL